MAQHAHDPGAERALLGAAILSHHEALPAFLSVPDDAYYSERHRAIASVIRDMVIRRHPVDAITVLSAIEEAGLVVAIGGAPYLHSLVAMPYVAGNAMAYADRLLELYGRRRLWVDLRRELQRLDADWEAGEEGHPVTASIATIRATCDELMAYAVGRTIEPPQSLTDLLGERDSYDWLVPGLLERRDRLILTGAEGFGKSELVSQLALCIAAGIHPFTGDPTEGAEPRGLIVDCENTPSQSRRRWRRIAGVVDAIRALHGLPAVDWGKRLHVEFRPSGLNLLKGSDVAQLEALVSATSPDFLVLGPLYKLHETNINDGQAARGMLAELDRIRERHGCALITEAHAGKASDQNGVRLMAPEGSSLFMRWPEFGFGLRRSKEDPEQQADVISWRGQREERDWPAGLVRAHSGLLPWRPTAEYYDRPDQGWGGQA